MQFTSAHAAVDEILSRTGKNIVLGVPLGVGKPNALVNALYDRVRRDAQLSLQIITALSLNPPVGKNELEERFLKPIRARVWGDYARLMYLDDRDAQTLPPNVTVHEFYMRSGSQLGNSQAQRSYISSNYTHVARDMILRGVNLLLQAVAVRRDADGAVRYSYASNPDVTPQLLRLLEDKGQKVLCAMQVNRGLPWFGGNAEVPKHKIDILLDAPELDHRPFAVPHEPVDAIAWAIGLHGSTLVRDGGTLQVGIGALGDAVCHSLLLRERQNDAYRGLVAGLNGGAYAQDIGGLAPFSEGLYVASELISNPLFALFEAGIVRRRVVEDAALQRNLARGEQPASGTCMQGAFFIGPGDFYQRLHNLSDEQRALIDMTSVAEVNRVYTHFELERLQRQNARFLNVTMKATLLGSGISDQLAGGAVVSGVGGQSEFVTMAHQLPDARSALLFRAVYEKAGHAASNIHFEFPHSTIPRHMRDMFVTEYGIADLRGKTDEECVKAMLGICDSRFQEDLAGQAKRAGKLASDYCIPDAQRQNVPSRLNDALRAAQTAGLLPSLPFGCDLTAQELALAARLRKLSSATQSWQGRGQLLSNATRGLFAQQGKSKERDDLTFALEHLALHRPKSVREHVLAQLVRAAYEV